MFRWKYSGSKMVRRMSEIYNCKYRSMKTKNIEYFEMSSSYERLPTPEIFVRKTGVIAYMSVINFIVTCIIAHILHKYILLKYNSKHNSLLNILKLFVTIVIIAITAYIVRQIPDIVPKPFASSNFDPNKVKEIKGSILTAFTFFMFVGNDVKDYLKLFNI